MSRHDVRRGFDPIVFGNARRTAGFSLGDLAREAQIGISTVNGWESGRRAPQVDMLARAAKAIGIPMSDIIIVEPGSRTLADWRNLAGLTQPQLAAAIQIRTGMLSRIERAEVPLSAERAADLADALGPALVATGVIDAPASLTVAQIEDAYERARTRERGTPP